MLYKFLIIFDIFSILVVRQLSRCLHVHRLTHPVLLQVIFINTAIAHPILQNFYHTPRDGDNQDIDADADSVELKMIKISLFIVFNRGTQSSIDWNVRIFTWVHKSSCHVCDNSDQKFLSMVCLMFQNQKVLQWATNGRSKKITFWTNWKDVYSGVFS